MEVFYETNHSRQARVGTLSSTGFFTPAAANPGTSFDVRIVATAANEKGQDGKPLVGKGYLVVIVNPHAVVEFDVKDDRGHVEGWHAELTTPTRLKGFTATSLEPGVVVTITGYRAKSGAPALWVTALTVSNGVELKVFSVAK